MMKIIETANKKSINKYCENYEDISGIFVGKVNKNTIINEEEIYIVDKDIKHNGFDIFDYCLNILNINTNSLREAISFYINNIFKNKEYSKEDINTIILNAFETYLKYDISSQNEFYDLVQKPIQTSIPKLKSVRR